MGWWFLAVTTNDLNIDIKYSRKREAKEAWSICCRYFPSSIFHYPKWIHKVKMDIAISATFTLTYITYRGRSKDMWKNRWSREWTHSSVMLIILRHAADMLHCFTNFCTWWTFTIRTSRSDLTLHSMSQLIWCQEGLEADRFWISLEEEDITLMHRINKEGQH